MLKRLKPRFQTLSDETRKNMINYIEYSKICEYDDFNKISILDGEEIYRFSGIGEALCLTSKTKPTLENIKKWKEVHKGIELFNKNFNLNIKKVVVSKDIFIKRMVLEKSMWDMIVLHYRLSNNPFEAIRQIIKDLKEPIKNKNWLELYVRTGNLDKNIYMNVLKNT